jgi:glycosyltransferase involved in cell wall biosynthesis
MRIAQVLASDGDGGLEKHVRELTIDLAQLGHEISVLASPQFLHTLPATIHKIPIVMGRHRRHPVLLWQIWRALRLLKPDIVHAQANKAVSLLSFLRPWVLMPFIGTLHNVKRQTAAYRQMHQVICVSHALAKTVKDLKPTVIYNGIEPNASLQPFHFAESLQKGKPVLCAIGRLVEAKGFDLLLDAVDGLVLNLVIAGEGPQRQMLAQRIQQMHPDTHVILLGHCDNVVGLMRECDGVVIASRREGFSYVLNEALLTETCVIATDVPIANEVLPNDLIVSIENVAALRITIERCLVDLPRWRDAMQPAFAFAQHQLTRTRMTKETAALYQTLINK